MNIETMTKTKEFKFRLTEKEFEEMRELAEKEGRTMSNLLRYLVAKERKLIEPYVPATSSSEKWFNAMLEQAKNDKIEAERILAKERKERWLK